MCDCNSFGAIQRNAIFIFDSNAENVRWFRTIKSKREQENISHNNNNKNNNNTMATNVGYIVNIDPHCIICWI